MKKLVFFSLILICGIFMAAANCLAATVVVLNDAPAGYIYPSEFDKLVMDLSFLKTDTLKALTIKNQGLARQDFEIAKVVLWQDNGNNVWEGLGRDVKIGEAVYSGNYSYWYWQNLTVAVNNGSRLFISIESANKNNINQDTNVQMKIPALDDQNQNGLFDLGDMGMFFASSDDNGPAADLLNLNQQVIKMSNTDGLKPKAVITNLTDGQTIVADSYLITGVARDAGGSYVSQLDLYINDIFVGSAASIEPYFTVWEFNWLNINPGIYNIKVWTKDGIGNFNPAADEVNITVSNEMISADNSKLTLDKTAVIADNTDRTKVTALVVNTDSLPAVNKALDITVSQNLQFALLSALTDSEGRYYFEVYCSQVGEGYINATVDGILIDSKTISCVASQPTEPEQPSQPEEAQFGDLIKASRDSVYYYGANGKRYVFPNLKTYLTWYSDFSTVKTITDAELAAIPIGGNVTYRPGTKMVKITTDPKVYAVGANGSLRWITSESVAVELFGANWGSLVEDVADAFFTNYTIGEEITAAADYNINNLLQTITTINIDKGL